MSNIGFDPKGFYEFDLARGAVSTRGGARVIVLSDTVVASLVSAAVETGDLTVLRELGKQIGAQVVASLGGKVFDDSPEQVLAPRGGREHRREHRAAGLRLREEIEGLERFVRVSDAER